MTVRNFTKKMREKLFRDVMNLKNLKILDIVDESQIYDWIPVGISVNIRNLIHLTFLDLSCASTIKEVEGLEELSQLTSLGLYGCCELRKLPDLFRSFKKLKRLCISHCHKLDLSRQTEPDEAWDCRVEAFHAIGESCAFGQHECLNPGLDEASVDVEQQPQLPYLEEQLGLHCNLEGRSKPQYLGQPHYSGGPHYTGGQQGPHYTGGQQGPHYTGGQQGPDYTGGQQGPDYTGGQQGPHYTGGQQGPHYSGGQQGPHYSGGQQGPLCSGGPQYLKTLEDEEGEGIGSLFDGVGRHQDFEELPSTRPQSSAGPRHSGGSPQYSGVLQYSGGLPEPSYWEEEFEQDSDLEYEWQDDFEQFDWEEPDTGICRHCAPRSWEEFMAKDTQEPIVEQTFEESDQDLEPYPQGESNFQITGASKDYPHVWNQDEEVCAATPAPLLYAIQEYLVQSKNLFAQISDVVQKNQEILETLSNLAINTHKEAGKLNVERRRSYLQ